MVGTEMSLPFLHIDVQETVRYNKEKGGMNYACYKLYNLKRQHENLYG